MGSETPGGEARDRYERLRAGHRARHQLEFGSFAGLALRLDGESELESRWRKRAEGDAFTGARFAKHFRGSDVVVLHDLKLPRTLASVDHVCIGPGGVTVVDSKNYRDSGRVRERRGGLWVGSRNRTNLIEGVLRQVDVVRAVLAADHLDDVDIRGALCWVNYGALPSLFQISVKGVRVDGPRPIARLARRKPRGEPLNVDLATAIISARLER